MPLDAYRNAYAGNPLDRQSARRADAEWLAARLTDSTTRVIALWNGSPLVTTQEDGVILSRLAANYAAEVAGGSDDLLFLGMDGKAAVFALELEGAADPVEGPLHGRGRFTEMRKVTAVLREEEAAIAATARAVFEWRRRHRFCAACGQRTRNADAGWRRLCPACRTEHFPRTDPVVIMLPVFGDRCLMGRQAAWDPGRFSALAGFLEPGESIEEACAREVKEEAGLEVISVRYHSSQPWPYPSTLMIGLIAEVSGDEATPDQTELEAVRWFTRAEARALIEGKLEKLSAPNSYAIAFHLLKAWAYREAHR